MGKKRVLVLLAEGFEEMEAIISIDMLRRANLDVITAGIGSENIVIGSRRISVKADMLLSDYKDIPDALVLPGGMPGALNLEASQAVISLIKKCGENKKIIAAICASPAYSLLKSGLLSGRRATCYPGDEKRFGKDITYVKQDVVIDGDIITSQGPGTALDFALSIIEKLSGPQEAKKVKEKALVR